MFHGGVSNVKIFQGFCNMLTNYSPERGYLLSTFWYLDHHLSKLPWEVPVAPDSSGKKTGADRTSSLCHEAGKLDRGGVGGVSADPFQAIE